MTDQGVIKWESTRGLYKASVNAVEECAAYYAEWETDKLAEMVSDTSGDDERVRRTPRFALTVMLAEWGAYGSHFGKWNDHAACDGFDPNSSAAGWHCYTHNLFNQEN